MKRLYLLTMVLAVLIAACSGASEIPSEDIVVLQEEGTEKEDVSLEEGTYGVEIIGGDEDSIRKFLLHQINEMNGDASIKTVVNIGDLPEDLPVEVPLSDNVKFVGSIARASFGMRGITDKHNFYTIFLESDLPLNETQELYSQLLENEGWQAKSRSEFEAHGFDAGYNNNQFSSFCTEDDETFLELFTSKIDKNLTSLRLHVFTEPDFGMCMDMSEMSEFGGPMGPEAFMLIPALKAPSDALIQNSGGGGGGPYDAQSTARIKTNLGSKELLEHYNQQLEDSDWILLSQNNSDEEAWSKWSFNDDEGEKWIGFLVMLNLSEESNSWYMTLQVFRSED